ARPPRWAGPARGSWMAGGDDTRRPARDPEGVERERHGPGVPPLDVERVAGDQDRVGAALDGLAHGLLERAALVGPPLGAAVRGQPSEGAAQMEVGNLKETRDCHVERNPRAMVPAGGGPPATAFPPPPSPAIRKLTARLLAGQ